MSRTRFVGARVERRQAVGGTCAIAALVGRAVLLPGLQFAAGRGAARINGTAHGVADVAMEGDAAHRGVQRALHGGAGMVERNGEFGRHAAAEEGIRLGPVERYAIMGATCATPQTGIVHGQPPDKKTRWEGRADYSGRPWRWGGGEAGVDGENYALECTPPFVW